MKRERCKDLVGRRIYTLRAIRNVAGAVIAKGHTARVVSTYRGRFLLDAGDGVQISQVPRSAFGLARRIK